jgi:hypothetical protein
VPVGTKDLQYETFIKIICNDVKHFKLGTVATGGESGNMQFTKKLDKKVDRRALDHVAETAKLGN